MDLKILKDTIENLDKPYQIEVGRILKQSNITMNENKNGIFINLTEIDTFVINKIERYLKYVKEQLQNIDEIEDKKQQFKDIFFNNNNSDVYSQ